MTRRINNDVFTLCGMEKNLRSVDGYALFLFFFQGVQQKSKLKLLTLLFADITDKVEPALWQGPCIR